MKRDFGKILTAMVTPMKQDFSVDYDAAAELAKYLIDNGSDGLVVAGSTGEAATLSKEEKLQLFKVVFDAVGNKATVIAGTGSNDTRASISLTEEAEKLGVHGVMLVGPYYNKPTQEGFYQHFKAIAQCTKLPVILYNVPGRTASNILPATILKLSEIDNIVAVKEASGNLDQVSEIIRSKPADFMVYSGDDSLTFPIMALGGSGVISVAAHVIGNEMQCMATALVNGDIKTAQEMHLKLFPFFKVIFVTTNPIPIKLAVNLIGQNAGPARLPLTAASPAEIDKLKAVMRQLDIKFIE